MRAQSGFLFLADLSGFTEFLTSTELEHGPAVANDLLGAVVEVLTPRVHVESLQGDAVFAVALDGTFLRPTMVLELIEQSFFAFKERQRQMQVLTTCTCNACKSSSSLELKFVLHHGSFVRDPVGDRTQLGGADVILVHRLLKNSVDSISCYLLATNQALRAMEVEPELAGMRAHAETYEHLGEIPCHVADLEPAWRAHDDAKAHRLGPQDGAVEASRLLAVPPEKAWDWIQLPDNQVRWVAGMNGVREENLVRGKQGLGTILHCEHGNETVLMQIVDWKPPRYNTVEFKVFLWKVWRTVELEPAQGGTVLTIRLGPAPGSSSFGRLVFKLLGKKQSTKMVEEMVVTIDREMQKDATREHAASGNAPPPTAATSS